MGVSERSSKTMRRTVRAVSTKESAHADHASDAAVRALILTTPRPYFLASIVSIPFYSTAVSQTFGEPLSEPRRAETPTAYLLRTQAMYACSLETERGFFEGVCAPDNRPQVSCDPPHHPCFANGLRDILPRWPIGPALYRIVDTEL